MPRLFPDFVECQINTERSQTPDKHQYHDKCYYEWINRQDNTCPLCVEKLDKNDNFKDTYVKIISIQKCLHRNFNELEFDFVEGKLTYKFIKGLGKNDLN